MKVPVKVTLYDIQTIVNSKECSNIVAIDVQLNGPHNQYIKEFAAYGRHLQLHYFLRYPVADTYIGRWERHHNEQIEKITGIPAMYPGESSYTLKKHLQQLSSMNKILFVYGENKYKALQQFMARNHIAPIAIFNLQHVIPSTHLNQTVAYSPRDMKFMAECNLNRVHDNRCALKKAVQLHLCVEDMRQSLSSTPQRTVLALHGPLTPITSN